MNSAIGLGQSAEFLFEGKKNMKWENTDEGVLLEHYFVFSNSGNQPLLIQDARVACPCTKVDFPKKPVLPGATDSIRVTFDTTDKYYYQDRIIELVSNTKKTEKLRLKVYVTPKED